MLSRSVGVPHACILPNTLRFCLACTLTHQYKPALLIFHGHVISQYYLPACLKSLLHGLLKITMCNTYLVEARAL